MRILFLALEFIGAVISQEAVGSNDVNSEWKNMIGLLLVAVGAFMVGWFGE